TSRRAEKSDEFALADCQRNIAQRIHRSEGTAHMIEAKFVEFRRGKQHPWQSRFTAIRPGGRIGRLKIEWRRGYFGTAATCSSQIRNAVTMAAGSNGNSIGLLAIRSAYSGRPNSLIASWLSCGAMSSVTSFTAGPG